MKNPYISTYIKKTKQIEAQENTNEREEASQYPPIISYDESGNEEKPSIRPISLIRSSKKRIKPIVATRPQTVCAAVHQCHPWITNADTPSTKGGFITE